MKAIAQCDVASKGLSTPGACRVSSRRSRKIYPQSQASWSALPTGRFIRNSRFRLSQYITRSSNHEAGQNGNMNAVHAALTGPRRRSDQRSTLWCLLFLQCLSMPPVSSEAYGNIAVPCRVGSGDSLGLLPDRREGGDWGRWSSRKPSET
jgi:hypothetical protein